MKATSKQEFFELLEYELNRIGIEDTDEIFSDFEEHFSDGFIRGIPESEVAESLGDIKEIARSYLNLESERINSIMARDVEHAKVSLTKPGHSVPADLSLVKDNASEDIKDIMNSDNIRSYTPEHLSEEIYPEAPNSTANSQGAASASGTAQDNSQSVGAQTDAASDGSADGAGNASAGATSGTQEKSVADAFSEAGRAAVDAAKIAGHAIADAFAASNVKSAVTEAGKSAAEAVKTASKSAADAINKAKAEHEERQKEHEQRRNNVNADSATQTSEVYPNGNSSAANTTVNLDKPKKAEKEKSYSSFSDFKGMKADVNAGKLFVAILLDVILWSWLIPAIGGGVFSVFAWAVDMFISDGIGAFAEIQYFFISRVFLAVGFTSLAGIIAVVASMLLGLLIKLIKYVVLLHFKAVYDV
ncbi:MAG: HAAS signaling domain-containing protein [Oscillospiraceae bacterium]